LELSPVELAEVTPIRLTVIRLAVPPGEVRIMSMSPTQLWVSVTSSATLLSGAVWPDTAKLITSGAPKTGNVPLPPSGIGPTPVPAKVDAGHGVPVGPGVAVGVAVPPGVAVGVAVPPGVAVGVAVPPGVGVGVGTPHPPLTLNTMCMFGNPIAVVVVGVVMEQLVALI